ncbi:MAG: tetratricopeptide repeat protein, partial [Armatimonadetes bacterium]|nr:tetratricopeptide repeat protein [Armatimonadota bacterium]NIM23852.1 tetratricopeptide repeat protein [Armatimonadota bacterium]NIM67731.1 tetratricopeptide repeat protein [Armatimonadota bacterium]NIM76240.1 tetratricopeptide repeat protein [Armatimonadota bacterium]NIN05933.1 tetratricopeptide repeat protein [Armatimonadota bacterium]
AKDIPATVKQQLKDLSEKLELFEDLGLPLNAEAHLVRGNAFFSEKDYTRAIECYDRTIEADLDYGTAHRNKGLALCKLGRQDEALA